MTTLYLEKWNRKPEMTSEKQITYWLETAKHDLETAEALFEKDKFDWCLFLGHLVLEKTLKAYWVKIHQTIPPKTHNLIFIAEKSNLKLSEEQQKFLATVTDFNLEARYPDEKLEFYNLCTKSFT